ncbi:hypothetical protein IFM89_001721 [Coptis chinensis]|uniref:Uncharacterized protein n=1 Tax=Coptis chinensis TaxID=261450 RepID=A0A835HI93_9MAGN|nr:hypothetical protein IFM89_001721 [Coptis chinensis]
MANGFEAFEPIFGKANAEWASSNNSSSSSSSLSSTSFLPFLFHVHALVEQGNDTLNLLHDSIKRLLLSNTAPLDLSNVRNRSLSDIEREAVADSTNITSDPRLRKFTCLERWTPYTYSLGLLDVVRDSCHIDDFWR